MTKRNDFAEEVVVNDEIQRDKHTDSQELQFRNFDTKAAQAVRAELLSRFGVWGTIWILQRGRRT